MRAREYRRATASGVPLQLAREGSVAEMGRAGLHRWAPCAPAMCMDFYRSILNRTNSMSASHVRNIGELQECIIWQPTVSRAAIEW